MQSCGRINPVVSKRLANRKIRKQEQRIYISISFLFLNRAIYCRCCRPIDQFGGGILKSAKAGQCLVGHYQRIRCAVITQTWNKISQGRGSVEIRLGHGARRDGRKGNARVIIHLPDCERFAMMHEPAADWIEERRSRCDCGCQSHWSALRVMTWLSRRRPPTPPPSSSAPITKQTKDINDIH